VYYGHANPLNADTVKVDLDDYVTVVSGHLAQEMFNADFIFIYDLPDTNSSCFFDGDLEDMRAPKYPHCTSLFICKADRPVMEIKLYFTEKGEKRKDEYLKMLNRSIWYNDDVR